MYTVDLYLRVRLACHVDGLSQREAASRFGIARETVGRCCGIRNRRDIGDASHRNARNWPPSRDNELGETIPGSGFPFADRSKKLIL